MDRPPANGVPAPQPPPPPPGRCHFWLPNKRRHCANSPIPSSQYCGNHSPESSSDSRRRVPCPVDPSHTVFEENLEAHVGKCPFRKQADALAGQPYYSKGINSGGGDAGGAAVTSASKRASVHKLSEEEFWALVGKIRSAHAAAAVQMRESYIAPDACDKWMKGQVDRKVPYQEKHVVQQVSIVGNMETFGLLPRGGAEDATKEIALKNAPAVVEFGAGRGYLTQMLADCYGIKNIFLVERRAYKLKADRSLRQNEGVKLERLRIDIEDLNLHGVKALSGSQYLAIGKHLCGPATDMTIMCCLHELHNHTEEKGHDKHHLRGLALATCCHHLCQWKHYANKAFLSGLGIAEEEFHAMTWFSSWAVDGDHSSQDSLGSEDSSSEVIRNRGTEKPDPEIVGVDRIIRGIPGVERSALGFMCKDIIDTGRMLWLRSKGLDADLVSYVQSDISPENHLLMAKCKS
ncbi:tRNA:m(4)X modification enzyme TRM13-like isoform X1 [Triticum dicoccoides]|uniref:tRNA:m(4)X modification enzyme TRM13-like isoform X1 n=2 Tax=Triticum dicoccoides TaxID=85692 RepID=UPI001891ED0A|nr:tRNA:m(4)X modification enzyme TRM13-like isoform X1 [Triticum dicoccoides]